MDELRLTGGLVVDGTGAAPHVADVSVAGSQIVYFGPSCDRPARRVLDVSGRVVCPGFVDLHAHSDVALLSNPEAHSKVRQGVTTEVNGNCGLGVVPASPGSGLATLRGSVSYLDVDPAIRWDWRDMPGYLAALRAVGPSINVATLVGHLPLHAAVVGYADQPATGAELDRMSGLLGDALAAGAAGLSTGLVYAPLTYVTEAELVALGRVVAAAGRLFAWHLRDYADELLGSVTQAVRVAESTGCRTQVSHLVAVGRRNWGSVERALDLVDAARERGVDVAVDIYPYLAGSANLSQLLPAWAHQGGAPAMLDRLSDPAVRQRVRTALLGQPLSWADIVVDGRSIASRSTERGVDGAEVLLDLITGTGNAATMVAGGRSERDLRAVLAHPASVVGSDGFALDPAGPSGSGVPHPRSYGCYPRLLTDHVGPGRLSLESAVAKCTAAPAARAGITDRGRLAVGLAADIVAFDPDTLADRATYVDPHRHPDGIELVLVNGEVVVHDGRHTGARAGGILQMGDTP